MKRLALLGARGHGKVVADAALSAGWHYVDFFDDGWPEHRRNGRWSVAGDSAALLERLTEFDGVLVSIGNCRVRLEKQLELEAAGAAFATVVHPAASVSRYAVLGVGTVVMAGAIVAVDATVGPAGIINTGATVDHDCKLARSVHVAPGGNLSGSVIVGDCSWIGVGAAVKQGITVGSDVTIGAGAVVIRPVPDGQAVVGNPARIIRVQKID